MFVANVLVLIFLVYFTLWFKYQKRSAEGSIKKKKKKILGTCMFIYLSRYLNQETAK